VTQITDEQILTRRHCLQPSFLLAGESRRAKVQDTIANCLCGAATNLSLLAGRRWRRVRDGHLLRLTCTTPPPPPPQPPRRRWPSPPPTASSAVSIAPLCLFLWGIPSSTSLTRVICLCSEGRRGRDDRVRRQRALRRALLRPAARSGPHAHPPRRQGPAALSNTSPFPPLLIKLMHLYVSRCAMGM
jgi:hypothetical protein